MTAGFTQQPANQTRLVGQTATFTVAATPVGAAGPLTYQWTTNGLPVSGATNASYTTSALTLANSGEIFQCTVGVSNTTVLSQTAVTDGGQLRWDHVKSGERHVLPAVNQSSARGQGFPPEFE